MMAGFQREGGIAELAGKGAALLSSPSPSDHHADSLLNDGSKAGGPVCSALPDRSSFGQGLGLSAA